MSNQNTEHIVIKSEMPLGAQSNIRLILQDFFAGILCDRRARPEIWHWIVQRKGCPDILNWGHEETQEKAEEEARAYLQSLIQLRNFSEQQTNSARRSLRTIQTQ